MAYLDDEFFVGGHAQPKQDSKKGLIFFLRSSLIKEHTCESVLFFFYFKNEYVLPLNKSRSEMM